MLTGQSEGSRPITDSGVLGFALAFGGLLGIRGRVASMGGLEQRIC